MYSTLCFGKMDEVFWCSSFVRRRRSLSSFVVVCHSPSFVRSFGRSVVRGLETSDRVITGHHSEQQTWWLCGCVVFVPGVCRHVCASSRKCVGKACYEEFTPCYDDYRRTYGVRGLERGPTPLFLVVQRVTAVVMWKYASRDNVEPPPI